MKRSLGVVIAVALLAGALAGCSSPGADPAAPAAAQWLAVARGEVDVEGGMALVSARTDGIVEGIAARQGDAVAAGQVLATLDPRAARIEVATAKAGVAQAQAQRDGAQVALQQAGQAATRADAAARIGAATGTSAAQARGAVAVQQATLAAASAGLDAARQRLAAAELALAATSLRAPVAGTVVSRHIALGQVVSAQTGAPLFEILPDRAQVVHAQLDAGAAGDIHAGMRAEVVPDSGAGPAYAAKVTWVGRVLRPADLTSDPLARALATDVDCTLELEPAPAGAAPLRIGQRVLVRFPRADRDAASAPASNGKRAERQSE